MWLVGYALSKGMRIKYSEGLIKVNNAIAGVTEKRVIEALGLPCPLPSEREIAQNKPTWNRRKINYLHLYSNKHLDASKTQNNIFGELTI
jgi:hypothetical protein